LTEGQGFAKRITASSLSTYRALLAERTSSGRDADDGSTLPSERHSGVADQAAGADPEIRKAEEQFRGNRFDTGVKLSVYALPAAGYRYGAPFREKAIRAVRSQPHEPEPANTSISPDSLYMRILPRRDGTQVQISMIVLDSTFFGNTTELVTADGGTRTIGFDKADRGITRVANNARFEAPEIGSMSTPVAQFYRDAEGRLHFRAYDADSDAVGRDIYSYLVEGVQTPALTNLRRLSTSTTVQSKGALASAQLYRLS
jgi:hypothetical protein